MMKARMEWMLKFIHYLSIRFFDDKLANIAAMLTLTSLLAVIPLLAVIFSILAALPMGQDLGSGIQAFIFSNFMPAFSSEIEQTISGFVEKASAMQSLGFSTLVISAILLLRTIDKGFNQIWQTKQQRKAIFAFIVYWLVLTLGPLLLGVSIVLSSYFTSLLLVTDTTREIGGQLTILLPWILTTIGLTLLYIVVPNSRIKLSHAVIGAIVAGLFFEISKILFTAYVTSFPLQEIIFGALSAVPLFIIWVYISWSVILLGAEVCHGLENFEPERDDNDHQKNYFLDCLSVLKVIASHSKNNNPVDRAKIIEVIGNISDQSIAECLLELNSIGLIVNLDKGLYGLLIDLEQYTTLQFVESVQWKLPSRKMIENSEFSNKNLAKELEGILQQIESQPTYSLTQSYRQG